MSYHVKLNLTVDQIKLISGLLLLEEQKLDDDPHGMTYMRNLVKVTIEDIKTAIILSE